MEKKFRESTDAFPVQLVLKSTLPKFSKIPGGTPLHPTPVNFGGVIEVGEGYQGKIKLGPAHFRFGHKSRSKFWL
jgi:hypothetical protein